MSTLTREMAQADLATTVEDMPLDIPVLPAEPEVDRVLTILRNARDAVKFRWVRHTLQSRNGAVCAVGGIAKADGAEWDYYSNCNLSREAMEAIVILGNHITSKKRRFKSVTPAARVIFRFNDHGAASKADVLAGFDRAIAARKESR
jgi:hypothetical protein